VEDDVDIWCYAIVSCMPETTMTTMLYVWSLDWFPKKCTLSIFAVTFLLVDHCE